MAAFLSSRMSAFSANCDYRALFAIEPVAEAVGRRGEPPRNRQFAADHDIALRGKDRRVSDLQERYVVLAIRDVELAHVNRHRARKRIGDREEVRAVRL